MFKNAMKYGAAAATAFASFAASAESQLPAGTLTAVTTDAVDTVQDLVSQGLPLVTGIALAWFIVTGVKKLLSKGGIR
jgi:hypothetical protein